jgi:hypothetical protein
MALHIIGTIFKILAWIVLIFGILIAIALLVAGFALNNQIGIAWLDQSSPLAGVAMFVVSLVATIIQFLTLYAAGEFIYLFLSIEENTRRYAYFAQQEYTSQQAGYAPSPSEREYGE